MESKRKITLILSDIHYKSNDDDNGKTRLEDLLLRIKLECKNKKEEIDKIIINGDIADDYSAYYEIFDKIHASFPNAKILTVPGNHDSICSISKASEKFSREKGNEIIFYHRNSEDDYSYQDENNIYIMLNSQELGEDGEGLATGGLSDKQISFLKAEINKSRSIALKPLIFMHHPHLKEKGAIRFLTEILPALNGTVFFKNSNKFSGVVKNSGASIFVGHYHQTVPHNGELIHTPSCSSGAVFSADTQSVIGIINIPPTAILMDKEGNLDVIIVNDNKKYDGKITYLFVTKEEGESKKQTEKIARKIEGDCLPTIISEYNKVENESYIVMSYKDYMSKLYKAQLKVDRILKALITP